MRDAERTLVRVLRLVAMLHLMALPAAFLPFGWMAGIHGWLGLGELPDIAITGYLARSLSALLALDGVLMLYISFDVRRYMPLIRVTAMLTIVLGVGIVLVDCCVGMPWLWTVVEGALIIAVSAWVLQLATMASSRQE